MRHGLESLFLAVLAVGFTATQALAQTPAEQVCQHLAACEPNTLPGGVEECVALLAATKANAAGSSAAELFAPCIETLSCGQLAQGEGLRGLCVNYWAAAMCQHQFECDGGEEASTELVAECAKLWLTSSEAGDDYVALYGACNCASSCESLMRGTGDRCRFDFSAGGGLGTPFSAKLLGRLRDSVKSPL